MAPARTTPTYSKSAWAKRAVHAITLPSGMAVKIRIPNLGQLIKRDMIPQRLQGVALQQILTGAALGPDTAGAENGASPEEKVEAQREMVRGLIELTEWLVVEMVVEPKIELDDLPGFPQEDLDMLVSIAQRERDTDALGVRLGVTALSRWEVFRRHHGCEKREVELGAGEECPDCQAVRGELSTTHMGPV